MKQIENQETMIWRSEYAINSFKIDNKHQKLFVDEFKDYDNAIKITCSVAKYEKIEESFFELEI